MFIQQFENTIIEWLTLGSPFCPNSFWRLGEKPTEAAILAWQAGAAYVCPYFLTMKSSSSR